MKIIIVSKLSIKYIETIVTEAVHSYQFLLSHLQIKFFDYSRDLDKQRNSRLIDVLCRSRHSFPLIKRKKERELFRGPATESTLQNQKFTTTRKRGKPNPRRREREREKKRGREREKGGETRGSPSCARPPLPVMPVTIETPPRRPRVPSHPRTAQTPPPLSRSLRYSPSPLAPLPSSLLVTSSTPNRLPKPPFARVHQEPVSIRGRVRGPTYSTGSATDNEIVCYHSRALSPPLPALLFLISRSLSVSRAFESNAPFYLVSLKTPLFPSLTPPSISPRLPIRY